MSKLIETILLGSDAFNSVQMCYFYSPTKCKRCSHKSYTEQSPRPLSYFYIYFPIFHTDIFEIQIDICKTSIKDPWQGKLEIGIEFKYLRNIWMRIYQVRGGDTQGRAQRHNLLRRCFLFFKIICWHLNSLMTKWFVCILEWTSF